MYEAIIYTDGSCHTQHKLGAWATMLFIDDIKINLSGFELDTTHNRMELLAVLKSLEYILSYYKKCNEVKIITDSQYVVGLISRKQKLLHQNFITKKGAELNNSDLINQLFNYTNLLKINFEKIKAHSKFNGEINYNNEVDKISRSIVRTEVAKLI